MIFFDIEDQYRTRYRSTTSEPEHLESCTPGQDQENWYSPVHTGTYQYMTEHDSTRILHLYETVRTGMYWYVLEKQHVVF